MADYAITFACYNQVDYTRRCIESLVRHGYDLSRVVVVDNASRDETRDYLETLPLGGRLWNRQNLGCGVAWNQGVWALQAEWSVVMNNDVVVSAQWLERLIGAVTQSGIRVACPAIINGPLDYDFESFSQDASRRMEAVLRRDSQHAMCMCIHRSVWERVGYFRSQPNLWGYEDTLFFNALQQAGIGTCIAGASWLHHFGSVTVNATRQERGLKGKQGLGARDNYKLLGKSTLRRKLDKYQRIWHNRACRDNELARYGMTVYGHRRDGHFEWE